MTVPMTKSYSPAIAQITALYEEVNQYYPSLAEELLELIDKLHNQEVMIGFAGHFSAGKSTMINHLAECSILPSSPIPTSANIVKLFDGPDFTTIHYNKVPPEKYEGSLDLETIQTLCRDGDTIRGIDISRSIERIPSHVKILDTPGVDSANDADRLITESSLHLMDFMYYVMDYNHVQSEVNLNFLLEMQKRQMPFSIVINQVDKHKDEELSFERFLESVNESFKDWGIHPEGIYYTSLKELNHPYNRLSDLKRDFEERFTTKHISDHALLHAEAILEVSEKEFTEQFAEKLENLDLLLEKANQTIEQENFNGSETLLKQQEDRIPKAKEQFQERLIKFIFNAYLMPSFLRDKAREYLESAQTDFKVGLLFSKKKTAEEKQQRYELFIDELEKTMEKNLIWPLKERLISYLEEQKIINEALLESAQTFQFIYSFDRVSQLIESGAAVTGEYVLRYTNQLTKDIQKQARNKMNAWWKEIENELNQQTNAESVVYRDLIEAIHQKEKANEEINTIQRKSSQFRKQLTSAFKEKEVSKEAMDRVLEELNKRSEAIIVKSPVKLSQTVKSGNYPEFAESEESLVTRRSSFTDNIEEKAKQIQAIIDGVDGLQGLRSQLEEKQQRLANRQYTIALFGAFSAGKSSFANALLGDHVLPVSPNPTTATINKISPPTVDYPHQTVMVKVKSEAELIADLNYATDWSLPDNNLLEIYDTIQQWDETSFNRLAHKKRSFLRAFVNGYQKMFDFIGETMMIAWDEVGAYVSEERTSCFIEWVEMFYDCEWTREGITLVDTPGADSVNSRHTNVSFEYIKNADAILFVTYFNHPFSKADQSFLTQLGRVKDAFSMDKMFFIVNAADLASSEEEKLQVEDYLRDQLLEFQIRKPRIFSLSSLQGLQEKKELTINHSGLADFEQKFENFLREELAEMLYHSIEHDISEIVSTFESFIHHASLDEQQKEEQLRQLESEKHQADKVFNQFSTIRADEAVSQKVNKQLYYVHERLMLNFNDFFTSHINPAVINGQRTEAKEQLKIAAKALLQEVEFEMNQEIRAVVIRMETFTQQMLDQYQTELLTSLKRIKPSLELENHEWGQTEAIQINQTLSVAIEDLTSIFKIFKGTKSFFEANEKEKMRDEIAHLISEPLRQGVMDSHEQISQHFKDLIQEKVNTAFVRWQKEVESIFDRLMYSLRHQIDIEDLQKRLDSLTKISQ
ncbi:dynamin family protein [Halobacillus seohaensis]|uniref:Dynamin family protein n=1 Tax=Halobacillus seohaensis TaxID=447421 RepID=A0ABW2EDI3_9BACI